MIFATVGSMFPFDRLARSVDGWSGRNPGRDVLIQIGSGEYQPQHARWVRMLRPTEFSQAIATCSLVVAHLGMGSIITAMQARKSIVLLPRIYELGEHTSDHQMHGTEWLRDKPGIWIAQDERQLQILLDDFQAGRIAGPSEQVGSTASEELIGNVRRFIADRSTS